MFWKKKKTFSVKAEFDDFKRAARVKPMDISMFSPSTQAQIIKTEKLGNDILEHVQRLRQDIRNRGTDK